MTLDEALASLPAPARPLKPLAPSFLDPRDWRPSGTKQAPGWDRLRAEVLTRDAGCVYCGYSDPNGTFAAGSEPPERVP